MLGLINNLEKVISNLRLKAPQTEWADYLETHNYKDESVDHKRQVAAEYLSRINPSSVLDLEANVGFYSRVASDQGIPSYAFDLDHGAVERKYRETINRNENSLLPLLMDLSNPSPDIDWVNRECLSLIKRGQADAVMALALIHHLAIYKCTTEKSRRFFCQAQQVADVGVCSKGG